MIKTLKQWRESLTKLHRALIPGRTWSLELLARLKGMVDNNWSAGQIATELGLSRNQVIGACSRNGYQLSSRPATTPANREAQERKRKWASGGGFVTNRDFNLKRAEELKEGAKDDGVSHDPNPASVHIMEAEFNHCRRPLWSTLHRTGLVCGKPVIQGKTHCKDCQRILYQAPVLRKR